MRKPLFVLALSFVASLAGCSIISFSVVTDSSQEASSSSSEETTSSIATSETTSSEESSSASSSEKSSSTSSEASSESSSSQSSSEDTSSSEEKSYTYNFKDTNAWWSSTATAGNYIDTYAKCSFRIEVPQIAKTEELACYYLDGRNPYIGEYIVYGNVYTWPDEVALYYLAYRELPPNYGYYYTEETQNTNLDPTYDSANNVYQRMRNLYGDAARLYTDYSRSSGYVTVMPRMNRTFYYELDLAITSNYGSGSGKSRGAGRMVIFPDGTSNYTPAMPFIVRTYDHYEHFREFSNTLDGWGKNFDGKGVSDEFGSYTNLVTLDSPYLA